MDAMSDAVDNAAVMLSCLSLAYKESANCRLEAQYGHQQEVDSEFRKLALCVIRSMLH